MAMVHLPQQARFQVVLRPIRFEGCTYIFVQDAVVLIFVIVVPDVAGTVRMIVLQAI